MAQQTPFVSPVVSVEKGRQHRWGSILSFVGLLLLWAPAVQARNALDFQVSGYELFPGIECSRNSAPATCGVTFSGWTGGEGAVTDGWSPFPGNRQGFWEATIDRQGIAAFTSTVTVLSGTVTLALTRRHSFLVLPAQVTTGAVQWPAQGETSGCGINVARVAIDLVIPELANAPATFDGCLHDLPVGTVLPPTIWGTFSIPWNVPLDIPLPR